jgi:hypothetical protein
MTLWIDHVVVAVADLDRAASHLRDHFGLHSYDGGRHPAWGTGNRIVPLGRDYVELLGVLDPDVARDTAFGRRVSEATRERDRLFGWCVASDDLSAEADRLALQIEAGSRVRPDGRTLRWRAAGYREALEDQALPFFLEWDVPPELHPGRLPGGSGSGIVRVDVRGDAKRLARWLGPSSVPVTVSPGPSAVLGVVIGIDRREVVLQLP